MKARKKIKRRPRKLKVAHVAPCAPHQCGLYETARELVLAERRLGINAHIVDPRPSKKEIGNRKQLRVKKVKCPKCSNDINVILEEKPIQARPPEWASDREVCIAPLSFAMESDVIVSHSGLDNRFAEAKAPRIHVAHGRPNSSYRIERSGGTPIYTTYYEMTKNDKWKTMVTLWPGYEHYWRLVFPDVRQFRPFVDLDFWKRCPTKYEFNGKGGGINVVIADIWRMDKDPFHVINAFSLFSERHPEARLHCYAIDEHGAGRDVLLKCLKDRGVLGDVQPIVGNLIDVYNAADMLITPHKVATRTVRESLACGLQVVAGSGNPYTPYTADEEDLPAYAEMMERAWTDWKNDREGQIKRNRATAEREFNVDVTARQFADLFEELTGRNVA